MSQALRAARASYVSKDVGSASKNGGLPAISPSAAVFILPKAPILEIYLIAFYYISVKAVCGKIVLWVVLTL